MLKSRPDPPGARAARGDDSRTGAPGPLRPAAFRRLRPANDLRDSRLGRKPADRRPTVEDGVHSARCGGDAFSVEWRGKSRRVDRHLKSGGSTHDPRRCLRIYYFRDSARNQAVVASMPAHLRTAMT